MNVFDFVKLISKGKSSPLKKLVSSMLYGFPPISVAEPIKDDEKKKVVKLAINLFKRR